ncbi:prolipoprotein diacylglyceryl transferase [bacterium]|nr:prolipoprotein diacylglyceryl transferase [bacterium]
MDPIAFNFGNLAVHWYGMFMAIGLMVGLWAAGRRALQENISPDIITDSGLWIMGGAVIGARLFFIITHWEQEFAGEPLSKMIFLRAGFVFYGGLIGASIAFILFTRKRKIPLWKLADIVAPSIPLGHAFGRLGCLMTGCCHGSTCDLPWAIEFPEGHASHPHSVHPTQIYEAILLLVLCAGLIWLWRRKKFDGHVFSVYLLVYACMRGFVELFRGDYPENNYIGPLTPGQVTGIVIFTIGLALFLKLPRILAPNPESATSES